MQKLWNICYNNSCSQQEKDRTYGRIPEFSAHLGNGKQFMKVYQQATVICANSCYSNNGKFTSTSGNQRE